MNALYNDIEEYAVKLLKLRIDDGWLPQGRVTNADIRRLCKIDLSKYNQVHLFAGIGGFPLAARLAGVPDDFRLFTGGFPCQPFSNAGQRAGTQDHRYLWPQTLAALKSHRPDVAILENVAGLASMGFPKLPTLLEIKIYRKFVQDYVYRKRELAVLHKISEDIEQAGYTVQTFIIPACGVDAKHKRDRIWIVCFRNDLVENTNGSQRWPRKSRNNEPDGENARREKATIRAGSSGQDGRKENLAHSNGQRKSSGAKNRNKPRNGTFNSGEDVTNSDTASKGFSIGRQSERPKSQKETRTGFVDGDQRLCENVPNATSQRQQGPGQSFKPVNSAQNEDGKTSQFVDDGQRCIWPIEPDVGRVANGVSGRVDRIKGLGNAIVPQVAAEILMHVMAALEIEPEWHI